MSTTKMTYEQIISRVKDIFATKTHLDEKDDGIYEVEIYADYRDELDSKTIEKIFGSDNPREKFEDMVSEWYQNSEFEIEDNIINTVKNHFEDKDKGIFFDKYEEYIRAWIKEHLYFKYPHAHFLKQGIYVDIIVNTGDGNYDFTMNELFGSSYRDKDCEANSSVIWLLKQQGYSKRQIIEFIEKENFQGSKLLESVYHECLNTTTCMNALSFFVTMTLEEYFNLYSVVVTKNKTKDKAKQKELILEKGTPCGLYDPWNGAGSMLEIKLEKDVVLPIEFVDSAYPDGQRGYGITSIYGLCSSFWKSNCVKIV